MAEKKVIELEVRTNTPSLKAQLRMAQQEVQELADKFGATSKQAVEAAKKAAELKDAIAEAKDLTDAFNPDAKFNSLKGAISGALNGVQAFEGALALVGVESKDVQETLLKVQGAMALTEGINGVLEAKDAFKILKASAVDALKGIKTGLLATGIGIFVVVLGTIVAYWDDIKAAVSGVSEEQKKLNVDSQKNLDIQNAKLTTIDKQENILKLQGKSEKDILNIKIAQTDEAIKAAEILIKNTAATSLAQIEASKRNKEILSGMLQFLSLPITMLLRTVDDIGNVLGKDFGLNKKFYEGLAGFVFDPKEVEQEIKDVKKQQADALTDLKNSRAGFVLAVKAIDKTAADDAAATKKTADDAAAEILKKQKEDAKANLEAGKEAVIEQLQAIEAAEAEYYKNKKKERQQDLDDVNNKFFQLIEAAKTNGVDTTTLLEAQKAAEKEINDKYDKEANDKEIEKFNKSKERAKKAMEEEKALADAKFQVARDTFSTIGNLASAFAGSSEREQKKAFEIQKAANIAGATMDTYKAATGAYASLAEIPVVGPGLGIAAAGLAIASGLANVKNISSQHFNGGGNVNAPTSAGGNNNKVVTPNFNIIGNQNQTQLAQLNQAPIKAYVVGSDVTTQQMLDKKKIQNATI